MLQGMSTTSLDASTQSPIDIRSARVDVRGLQVFQGEIQRVDITTLEARGLHRRFAVMVPGFAGVPAFLRGSPLLATDQHLYFVHFVRPGKI